MRVGLPVAFPGMSVGLLGGSFDPAHEGHAHLTREALKLYLSKLSPNGVLALHITNRHLALLPVVTTLAKDAGLVGRLQDQAARAGRERSLMLSALLRAEAELASDADMGAQFYQKSLDLLLATHLQQPELALPDYAPSVAQLTGALADYQVPPHTGQLLARYYEQAGAFAQAEDQLYELRAQSPDSPTVRQLGEAW